MVSNEESPMSMWLKLFCISGHDSTIMDKAFPAKGSTSTEKEKTFLCKYLEGVNRLLLSTLSSNELLVPASTCMYSNNFIGVSYQWYQRWKWAVKPPLQCRICRIQAESQIRSFLFPDPRRCSSFSKWLTKRSWSTLLMMAFCARSSSPSKSASGASFSQLCSPERGGEKMGARQNLH